MSTSTAVDKLQVEAAILPNISAITSIVKSLISGIQSVRHFPEECRELANISIALSTKYEEVQDTLQVVRSAADFVECLRKVSLFVEECKVGHIFHVGWERITQARFQDLKANLDRFQRSFDTEVLMTIHGSTSRLLSIDANVIESIKEARESRLGFLRQISELKGEITILHKRQVEQGVPEFIQLPDSCVRITSSTDEGQPRLGTYYDQPATFERIQRPPADQLGQIIKVYKLIGNVALVQKFLAITDFGGIKYALMESLDADSSLAKRRSDRELWAKITLTERLIIAYELAATVSALHSAHIVIKILCDTNIYLQESGKGRHTILRPKIANLKKARAIWEVTSREEQDQRFEAPEVKSSRRDKVVMHSLRSDIWTLGVVLAVLFFDTEPDSVASSLVGQTEAFLQSRVFLAHRNGPSMASAILTVVKECCEHNAVERTKTASQIAQHLFDLLQTVNYEAESAEAVTRLEPPRELRELASRITSEAGAKRDRKRFVFSDLESLIEETTRTRDPHISMAVGLVYLYYDIEGEGVPAQKAERMAQNFLASIPHLQTAHEGGEANALPELARAHGKLSKYYDALTQTAEKERT